MKDKKNHNSVMSIHEVANIDAIASSGYSKCSLNEVRRELISSQFEDEPGSSAVEASDDQPRLARSASVESNRFKDYQAFFSETQAKGNVDHDSSILSPAAYFVDLMRLVVSKISKPNAKKIMPGLGITNRRSDLIEIPLDAENTITEIPYLEIVNDVLAHRLSSGDEANPLLQLATGIYPFNLPYHAPLDRIRAYLKHFDTDLATVYEIFDNAERIDVARECLELSKEEYLLISTPDPSRSTLSKAYGLPESGTDKSTATLVDLYNVPIFLSQTGLSLQQLTELLDQGLSSIEDNSGSRGHLFINRGLENESGNHENLYVQKYVQKDEIMGLGFRHKNVSETALDRLHRFIRLANKLQMSFAELDWSLISIKAKELDQTAIIELAKIKRLRERLKLPIDELTAFWHDIKHIGQVSTHTNRKDLYWRIFARDNQSPLEYLTRDKKRLTVPAWLSAALKMTHEEMLQIVRFALENKMFEANGAVLDLKSKKIPLNDINTTRIYRFKKLSELLSRPLNDSLKLLKILNLKLHSIDDLELVTEYSYWLKESQMTVSGIAYMVGSDINSLVPVGYNTEKLKALLEELSEANKSDSSQPIEIQKDNIVNPLANFFGIELPLMRELLLQLAKVDKNAAYLAWLLDRIQQPEGDAFMRVCFGANALNLTPAEIKTRGTTSFDAFEIKEIHAQKNHDAKFPQEEANAYNKTDQKRKCYALAKSMGVEIEFLYRLSNLYSIDLNSSKRKIADWKKYESLAQELHEIARINSDPKQWQRIHEIMLSRFNESERDALVVVLMHHLKKDDIVKKYFGGMDTIQDLSDYLLIDVEMGGAVKVSKIKQGINTLQRYIQRCQMGLEMDGDLIVQLADRDWAWRSHYRLWEANRKVFLYPENYIEPTLRKQKTPLFQELEDELLQNDMTIEYVTKAYINYFDKLDELTSLQIADTCVSKVVNPQAINGEDTLFVVGRTKNEPPTYYLRTAVLNDDDKLAYAHVTAWHPWQKIELPIHVDNIACLYVDHRLYLVWVEEKTKTDRTTVNDPGTSTTTATIKFSYQNVSGTWFPPQVLEKGAEVISLPRSYAFPPNEPDDQSTPNLILLHKIKKETSKVKALKFVGTLNGVKRPNPETTAGETPISYEVFMDNKGYAWGNEFKDKVSIWTKLSHSKLRNDRTLFFSHNGQDDLQKIEILVVKARRSRPDDFFIMAPKGYFPKLRQKLVHKGLDKLLELESQQEPFLIESLNVVWPYNLYCREIFFHVPFLLAEALNKNQRFEDAQKWYHYIFNPIAKNDIEDASRSPWQFQPFRDHTLLSMNKILEDSAEITVYNNDPFDPHAIAGLRVGAYEKAVVMKYIDNLLDWGDQLFSQDNWESIVQAMMLYVMAQNLLGKKSKKSRSSYLPTESKKYDQFKKEVDFSDPFDANDIEYFPIPANDHFLDYWERAADRLYKIRHSMNIKGIVRQLALFQPPIDPNQLIQFLDSDQYSNNIPVRLSTQVPHYRFTTMIQQAKNVTATLTQLSSVLLSALEKKDAEHLVQLRAIHEKEILNLTTRVKKKQLENAQKNMASLKTSLASAIGRKDHYQNLIDTGPITEEISSQNLMISALGFQSSAAVLHVASAPAYLVPTIYGLSNGGWDFGKAIQVGASASEVTAGVLNQGSQLAAAIAQDKRRKEEWQFQVKIAGYDVEQIQAQIEAATIMQDIAQTDLDMHQKSIEQAEDRENFLRGKFTNRDLYHWMIGQVSSVFFQTYKIAYSLAQAAEKAYQFERNIDGSDGGFISFGHWDSLKKGLLVGERLTLGLNQLEQAYMDENERDLEIEKTFSLLKLLHFDKASELTDLLKRDGKCIFELHQAHFDKDFPGHYCRKIKSIAITIPAVVGPYQQVSATLTQTANKIFAKPNSTDVISDWRNHQHVAISKGLNDSGLFELNFQDERYLPFEGTGAISSWQFEMREEANETILETISDIIIHLRYTAKYAAHYSEVK